MLISGAKITKGFFPFIPFILFNVFDEKKWKGGVSSLG